MKNFAFLTKIFCVLITVLMLLALSSCDMLADALNPGDGSGSDESADTGNWLDKILNIFNPGAQEPDDSGSENEHTHTFGDWYGDTATCTEDGAERRDCTVESCEHFETRDTDKLGHSWTAADCNTPKTCGVCSATEGEALGHDMADATCTLPSTCKRECGHTVGNALGHDMADATCTLASTCKRECGHTVGEALDHDMADATCTLPSTCKRECGHTVGNALGHDMTSATCTQPITCKRGCGHTVGSPAGHSWNNATCTEPKTCSVCSEKEGESLGGHIIKTGAAMSQSCVSIGWDAYEFCERCDYSTLEIKPELGHSYGDDGECTVCSTRYSLGLEFTSNGNGTCSVTGIGSCTDQFIIIPPVSPSGDTVVKIGYTAFQNLDAVYVEIPNTVTHIDAYVFENSKVLSIVIPSSVTTINYYTFSGFYGLKELVNNSKSVITNVNVKYVHEGESSIDNVDGYVFLKRDGVNYLARYVGAAGDITLPDYYNGEQYRIDSSAFSECDIISKVTVGEGVTHIGTNAFYMSSITALEFSEGSRLEIIDSWAFECCYYLESAVIPESVTYIGNEAFELCTDMTTLYFNVKAYPENWNDYGLSSAFYSIGSESEGVSVIFGKNVEYIPINLFNSYANVISITFEEGSVCREIRERALWGCGALKIFEIPEGITSIACDAFYDLKNLKELRFNAVSLADSTDKLFYQSGADGFKIIIGNAVEKIPTNLFYGSYAAEVVFESGSVCETIGASAFAESEKLTEIIIPAAVKTIDRSAFRDCAALSTVSYAEGSLLEVIGESAFSACVALKSIEIPENVTEIRARAFSYCTSLEQIRFNAINCSDFVRAEYQTGVFEMIGTEAENGTTLIIGNKVTKIPDYMMYVIFDFDHNLTSLVFEEGSVCERIGEDAFYGCKKLVSVEIPSSVKIIEKRAFAYCSSLTEIEYNAIECVAYVYSMHTTINYPFQSANNYTNLINLTIGKDVSVIPSELFPNSRIATIDFEEGAVLTTLTGFYSCSALTSVEIPASVTKIDLNGIRCTNLTNIEFELSSGWVYCEVGSTTAIAIPEEALSDSAAALAYLTALVNEKGVTYIDGELTILAIGSSYLIDTVEYMYDICHELGVSKIKIGNLYIGGCPMDDHVNNYVKDLPNYTYYENSDGTWTTKTSYKMSTALREREWDYIIIMNGGHLQGLPDAYSNFDRYISYIKNECPDSILGFNATWAYAEQSTLDWFEPYGYNQMTQYNAICDTMQNVVAKRDDIKFIIPNATAIQNLRTSKVVEGRITRDPWSYGHLTYEYGCYVAGLTAVSAILDKDIENISFAPQGVTAEEKAIAIESARNAIISPYQITYSNYR